ncbi:MAG: hypothetical protein ACTSRW_06750 [Candidatus Helarchaeota archaeon]
MNTKLARFISRLQVRIFNLLPIIGRQYEMVNPNIDDESEPFSYFAKPIMQLGCRGGKKATAVTPEGHLYTGALELRFLIGDPIEEINKRIKNLHEGYLPCIEFKIEKDQVRYNFQIFQYWLDKPLKSPLINYVKITLENHSKTSKTGHLGVGLIFGGIKHRPVGTFFNSGLKQCDRKRWTFNIENKCIFRDKKLILMLDEDPTNLYEKPSVIYTGPFKSRNKKLNCISKFDVELKSGSKKEITMKLPHYPIPRSKREILAGLEEQTWSEQFSKFKAEWKDLLEKGTQIYIPEQKVQEVHKACLMYNLMCQDFKDDVIIQKVNRFQYNDFWLRDSSFFSKMYAVLGYPEFSREILLNFLNYQQESGNFESQKGQLDGWGQSLWAFGEYIRISRDKDFAKKMHPRMMKAIKWLRQQIQKTPHGTLPATNAFDNEQILGRYTGHNFWVLHGLEGVAQTCKFLDASEDYREVSHLKTQFRNRLLKYLEIFTKNINRIPPCLDFMEGFDWSNLLMIYPTKIYEKNDQLVKATLNHYRKYKFKEGISTWARYLHHYVTERIAQSEIIMGRESRVLNDFYAMLLHTGSCHEGFEMLIYPWGNRDYELWILGQKIMGNYPPHGWFAANFNLLLRNMLLREEDQDLHLISTLSPEWLKPNSILKVENAPCYFGIISFSIETTIKGLKLQFKGTWKEEPERILVHVPKFLQVKQVKVNGKTIKMDGMTIKIIKPDDFELEIEWKVPPEITINYEIVVSRYKKQYRKLWQMTH